MLSKLTIEVDDQGMPYIQIRFIPSDDIRDKLIERFIQRFENHDGYATFYTFRNTDDGGKMCALNPNSPVRLAEHMGHIAYLTEPHLSKAVENGWPTVVITHPAPQIPVEEPTDLEKARIDKFLDEKLK